MMLHAVVVALLHCPPLLSLACSFVSYARGAIFTSSDPASGADPSIGVSMQEGSGGGGVCGLHEGGLWGGEDGGELGVYRSGGGREGLCMEVDW